MKTPKKKAVLVIKILLGLAFIALLCVILFRDSLLQKAILKAQHKFKTEYQSDLQIKTAEFKGLNGLQFNEITLVPHKADTLLHIHQLETSVNVLSLLLGDIQIGKLYIDKGYLQLVKNETGKNFDSFFKSEEVKDTNAKVNYAKLVDKILSKSLNFIPTDMSVKGFSVKLNDMGKKAKLAFKILHLSDKKLNTIIHVSYADFSQNWNISGFADPRNKKAAIKFFNDQNGPVQIPYLQERYSLLTQFDTVSFTLDNLKMSNGALHLEGKSQAKNFKILHPKISKEEVMVEKLGFNYHFVFGERFVAVDSSSMVQINELKCYPYLSYVNDADKVYNVKLRVPKTKAQTFINSLPVGMFEQIKGMKAQGDFRYTLDFEYNKNHVNDLIFKSNVWPENLKIESYGDVDLGKLNREFSYQAIENGVAQRAVLVGASNPNFTPLSSVSPYLKNGVLTNEDPSFFNHKGFVDEAFRMSIIKNIKTKKFTRGASTISMQLVKNVFLNREKTLSRKLEEIVLVYVMENSKIVSKQRMLEVYFNVIEWGPNVYGIGEAAHFYFQKTPNQLSLNESLFLASIVPSPKKFMYRFNEQGELRPYAKNQLDITRNLMLRRGLINETDTIGSNLQLKIEGNAKSYIRIKEKDSIVVDSLSPNLEFDF
jgi:hypothetical protein